VSQALAAWVAAVRRSPRPFAPLSVGCDLPTGFAKTVLNSFLSSRHPRSVEVARSSLRSPLVHPVERHLAPHAARSRRPSRAHGSGGRNSARVLADCDCRVRCSCPSKSSALLIRRGIVGAILRRNRPPPRLAERCPLLLQYSDTRGSNAQRHADQICQNLRRPRSIRVSVGLN
jgi:hypothetical protein